jgi:hypothetical protein
LRANQVGEYAPCVAVTRVAFGRTSAGTIALGMTLGAGLLWSQALVLSAVVSPADRANGRFAAWALMTMLVGSALAWVAARFRFGLSMLLLAGVAAVPGLWFPAGPLILLSSFTLLVHPYVHRDGSNRYCSQLAIAGVGWLGVQLVIELALALAPFEWRVLFLLPLPLALIGLAWRAAAARRSAERVEAAGLSALPWGSSHSRTTAVLLGIACVAIALPLAGWLFVSAADVPPTGWGR